MTGDSGIKAFAKDSIKVENQDNKEHILIVPHFEDYYPFDKEIERIYLIFIATSKITLYNLKLMH